jgi:Relaxase/Mobilisation nuclease domain
MRPFLDLVSYARHGPGRRDHFSRAELEIIARTVNRAPEVMVKVLNRGGQNLAAAGRHLDYLDREGELPIVTDDGQELKGKGVGKDLLLNWDLDLEEDRPTMALAARPKEKAAKLVHKVLFSMPPGTPPKKVLAAVKAFAREEFGAKHRYAMVLHTDEPHPHVHMVVKAMSEQGQRLNIRKATLRHWRQQFARQLREQGVAANATDRQVRGVVKPQKTDGIHRAAMRGASTHWRRRAEAVARELRRGDVKAEPGSARSKATRQEVLRGWRAVGDELVTQKQVELAEAVRRFVNHMPPPTTEKEWLVQRLLEGIPVAETEKERLVERRRVGECRISSDRTHPISWDGYQLIS